MSTDLEFPPGLPEIQPLAIKVRTSQSSDNISNDNSTTDDIIQIDKSDSEDECHTPTSPEHQIPAVPCCPPAPKKPRRAASCKRKLSELEFFEIAGREEVESFFRSSFGQVDINSPAVMKRRCPCT